MEIPVGSPSGIWRASRLARLRIAQMAPKAGLRESVRKFFSDLRIDYQARKKNKLPMEKRQRRFSIGYLIFAFVSILVMQYYVGRSQVELIDYSQFKSLLNKRLINDLAIGETVIHGRMKGEAFKEIFTPEKVKQISPELLEGKKLFPFETVRVEDPALTAELEAAKIPVKGQITSNWRPTILSWVVPVALFFLMWNYFTRKMGAGSGGLMQIGKSKAKVYIEKKTGVTFADVAGIDEAEE